MTILSFETVGDLSDLVFNLPGFEVRRIDGVDYVVLPVDASREAVNRTKILDTECVKSTTGNIITQTFSPTANARRTFLRRLEHVFATYLNTTVTP